MNLLWASNKSLILSSPSAAFMVILSSLPAHLTIFERLILKNYNEWIHNVNLIVMYLIKFSPRTMLRSHRNLLKPSPFKLTATKDTCEVSIACKDIPDEVHSQLASVTKSLMASRIFFRIEPLSNFASNIFCLSWGVCERWWTRW